MSRQFLNPYKCHTTPPSLFCLYESRCRPSSHFHQLTDYNTSACGARITTDDVAGSICEPPADKLRNYCPYSDSGSGYRALNTFISDLLSNQSTSLYAYIYIYIYIYVCVCVCLHQRCTSIPITLPPANRKLCIRPALFW